MRKLTQTRQIPQIDLFNLMIEAEMKDSGGVEVTKEDSGVFEVMGQKEGEPVEVVVL